MIRLAHGFAPHWRMLDPPRSAFPDACGLWVIACFHRELIPLSKGVRKIIFICLWFSPAFFFFPSSLIFFLSHLLFIGLIDTFIDMNSPLSLACPPYKKILAPLWVDHSIKKQMTMINGNKSYPLYKQTLINFEPHFFSKESIKRFLFHHIHLILNVRLLFAHLNPILNVTKRKIKKNLF